MDATVHSIAAAALVIDAMAHSIAAAAARIMDVTTRIIDATFSLQTHVTAAAILQIHGTVATAAAILQIHGTAATAAAILQIHGMAATIFLVLLFVNIGGREGVRPVSESVPQSVSHVSASCGFLSFLGGGGDGGVVALQISIFDQWTSYSIGMV